jgi:hypothetical protein
MNQARRYFALLGVVLAGAATIATSPKRWTLRDTKSDKLILDDAQPKRSVHVTVSATHKAEFRLAAIAIWPSANSRAEVRVTIHADGGGKVFEAKAAPFVAEGGAVLSRTNVAKGIDLLPGTTQGYTVSFERTQHPGDRVEIEWTTEVVSRELGDQPPGASVGVRVDPPPAVP